MIFVLFMLLIEIQRKSVQCIDLHLSTNGTDIEDKGILSGDILRLNCWLEVSPGQIATVSHSDVNWTSVNPTVTVNNRSWSGSFQFQINSNNSLSWFVDIPRLSITTDGHYWFPKEQWLLSTTIINGQDSYTKEISLLDITTEPILQWIIGEEVPAAHAGLSSGGVIWHSSVSPCVPDVVISAAKISTGQIGVRVTYAAFLGDSTSNYILNLCQYTNNCSSVELLDVMLTNYHLMLLTSEGLMVSNDMSVQPAGYVYGEKQNLTWTLVHPTTGYSSILVKYAVQSSQPFLSWTHIVPGSPVSTAQILDVAYNMHMETYLILFLNQTGTVGLQILSHGSTGNIQTLIREYDFGDGVNVTTIQFEPLSHTLFAYGEQVWCSFDGGSHFEYLLSLTSSDYADHMTFDHHGNQYLLHTRSGSMLYGMIGVPRMSQLETPYTSASVSYATVIDLLGHIHVTNLTMRAQAQTLDMSTNMLAVDEHLSASFIPVQFSVESAILYEYDGGSSVSLLDNTHIGQLIIYNGGGSGIIQNIDSSISHPDFISATMVSILNQFSVETASNRLDSPLRIIWQGLTSQLELTSGPSPGWSGADLGRCVMVYFTDSYIITSVTSSTIATAVSPLMLNTSWTVPSSHWTVLATAVNPAWRLEEDECRHTLTSDPEKQTVIELDIHDTVTISVQALITDPLKYSAAPYLSMSMSTSHLVSSIQQYNLRSSQHMQEATISITKDNMHRGLFSVRSWNPAVSLRCPRAAIVITIYLACPCRKRLNYQKPKVISKLEYLSGNPTDSEGALLYNLKTNYRPPSRFGVDIPTAEHIYNADPSVPRPNDRFRISKESGQYKQCSGKMTRSECLCTEDMMYSDDAAYSDCKLRVYRLVHPGILYPSFTIEQPRRQQRILDRQSYLVYIWEINDRVPEIKRVSQSDLLSSVISDHRLEQSTSWYTPGAVKIIMVKSGLHHFRAELPPGFSFCPLYSEFQVFVDQTPIAYPLQHILRFTVAMIIGGVMFVVYLWYLSTHHRHLLRPRGSQCQDIQDVHQYVTGKYPPSDYRFKMTDSK